MGVSQRLVARGQFSVMLLIKQGEEMHTAWVKDVDDVEIVHHPDVMPDPFHDPPDGILRYAHTGDGTLKLTWTPKTPPIDRQRLRCGRCGDDLLPSEIIGHLASEGRVLE